MTNYKHGLITINQSVKYVNFSTINSPQIKLVQAVYLCLLIAHSVNCEKKSIPTIYLEAIDN